MRPAIIFGLLMLGLSASAGDQPNATITVTPDAPLMDDVIQIKIAGLPPKSAVTVKARAEMRGRPWESHAVFTADDRGEVEVGKQAPSAGSYKIADPMGLFWSMAASLPPLIGPPPAGTKDKAPAAKDRPPAPKISDPRVTKLTVEADGKVVASAEVNRWYLRPGTRIRDVKENGLVGRLFEPETPGRYPAVLVLSGSEGGMNETDAALLASRGYTAFALAYFGAEGLPPQLVKIPLEYLKTGIDWLTARDTVDPRRLAVLGRSKGGELALLLAATYAEIKAVVAVVPSHVAWSGIGGTYRESSWTHQGKEVPFLLTRPAPAVFAGLASGKPVALIELYRPALDNDERVKTAIIPVEKIGGPVLLISGKDDQMWPSAEMSDKVIERLKSHRHPHAFEHLSYAGAGHAIGPAFIPYVLAGGQFTLGGNAEANGRAIADSRPKTLTFLRDALGNP